MTVASTGQLGQALELTGQLIGAVHEEQWAATTGCPGWRVTDLVSHLVTGNNLVTAALGGQPPAAGQTPPAAGELPQAFRESGEALLAAFARPGALEQVVTVPFGSVPGAVALHLRLTELLVHGWDLARATGQAVAFPGELVAQELAFSREALGQIPAGRSPFAPPQPVPAGAPVIDQLAALLGRDVTTG